MAVLKVTDVDKNLTKKGFARHDTDHSYYIYCIDGRKTIVKTKISHGEREIGDALISLMSRQTHVSKEEFIKLIECTMTEEAYRKNLLFKGIIRL